MRVLKQRFLCYLKIYKWLLAQCLYDSDFTLCFGSLLYSYAKTILQDVVLLAEHKHLGYRKLK